MRVKLTHDDRCAIDMVLEQRTSGDGKLPYCYGKQSASLKARVKKVEQLFDTMSQWPAEEPPANLVASTVKFIKRHVNDVPATHPATRRPASISHAAHRSLH